MRIPQLRICSSHRARGYRRAYRMRFGSIPLVPVVPRSQDCRDCQLAEWRNGADEIDIVLNVGDFLDADYESVCDEIEEQKEVTRDGRLKVILETGALKTARNIKKASILSLYSGADFLKTSTGKEFPGASLEAAYTMMLCIKEYYEKTGRMVGFKAAGGVSTAEDAVKYYTLAKENPWRAVAQQRLLPPRGITPGKQPAIGYRRLRSKPLLINTMP